MNEQQIVCAVAMLAKRVARMEQMLDSELSRFDTEQALEERAKAETKKLAKESANFKAKAKAKGKR